jgi:hypothetical protein
MTMNPAVSGLDSATGIMDCFQERHLGACPRMPFLPNSSEFSKNNARNIKYMAVLIF